jgi:crotonobetainyl-CoA:carnitine CoA-transferase CaiB-like acyl-CoA transferase
MPDAGMPLAGTRVIEIGSGIAGAYCGKILADAGAEVYLVEPAAGDPLRRWSSSAVDAGVPGPEGDGALFCYLHAGKHSLAPDPADPESVDDLEAIIDGAAIAILNTDGGPLAGLLDPPKGRRNRPALTIVTFSPFGRAGPWADRPAAELILQAWAGSMYTRGIPGREPLGAGGRTGEWVAGAFGALAALGGLRQAATSGVGDWADVSLLESLVLTHTVYQPLAESMGQPRAHLNRNVEIPSIEPAKDGWVGFCTVQARVWQDFCAMVGHPDWAADTTLRQWAGRAPRVDELRGAIAGWLEDKTVDEVIELASLLRIAVAPVGDGQMTPGFDHFVARGVFTDNPGGFIQPRPAFQIDGLPPFAARPAPAIGDANVLLGQATPGLTGTEQADEPDDRRPLPLAGLRVVDFTGAWAGSFCAQLVAMLGAEVVKIESTTHLDSARMGSVKPPSEDRWWEWAPIFQGVNTNKRAITLDLDTTEGLGLVKRLISNADVVLENFSPRVMDHFGLGWDAVQCLNPRAVMVRMPGFGLSGPWRDRIGFAQTMEQASGMAAVTGYEDGQPMIPRGICDPLGGLHSALGLMIALFDRDRSGCGHLVESSMIEAALNIAAEPIIEHSAYGRLLTRHGNRSPVAAPSGVYRCRGDDEWVALAVAGDAQWRGLRMALGDPPWAGADALGDDRGRRAHHDEIDGHIRAWCRELDVDEAIARLLAAGVPAGRVNRPWEVHDNPQLRARGFFEQLDHPVIGGHARYPGLPFRYAGQRRGWHRTPSPTLGQHNDDILKGQLDLAATEIDRLRAVGVIGERPKGL